MRQDEVVNPWAVCHAQLGKKKTKKFERCVMKVKAKHGIKENSHLDEQADYIAWILSEGGEARRLRQAAAGVKVDPGRIGYERYRRGARGEAPHSIPQGQDDAERAASRDAVTGGRGRSGDPAETEVVTAQRRREFTPAMRTAGAAALAGAAKTTRRGRSRTLAAVASKEHGEKALKTQRQERASRQKRLGGIGDHTEYEGPSLSETKDWIQKAINPAHKGYCTPMTKETCTPARKAFAKRAKRGDI